MIPIGLATRDRGEVKRVDSAVSISPGSAHLGRENFYFHAELAADGEPNTLVPPQRH
jgi:hypothetical protein